MDEAELDRMGTEIAEIVEREMKLGRRVSMAALQGLFIRSGASDAVEAVRTLFVQRGP